MYSSQFCPYCVNAEKLLLNKGIKKIKKIMVDENPSYMDEMIKITGEKTVPQIFIGDKHIGCLLYTSPSPRDVEESRMPSSA